MAFVNKQRAEVLSTYKRLMQLAGAMPTKGRRAWMKDKVRTEYRKDYISLRDDEEIGHRLALARAQIDNADVISRHLSRWLGRDDERVDPLDFSCIEPELDMLQHGYDYEKEWTEWLKLHPRHCQPHEAGTPEAVLLSLLVYCPGCGFGANLSNNWSKMG
eukprot:TRINITY_DN44762_c0_g1_i1.p1 TRINITY_DN44762_c0_g1~~TRINITY_DN44762_c0_g1_i1.p1  ORF type:complete len:160 (+),score=26.35 TRINITY_DN44762_c0_g1_i1:71-550(+)